MAHDSEYARRFLRLLVKQARDEKEWNQQYLADELDIDIRTLRKIEDQLANKFNCRISNGFHRDYSPKDSD